MPSSPNNREPEKTKQHSGNGNSSSDPEEPVPSLSPLGPSTSSSSSPPTSIDARACSPIEGGTLPCRPTSPNGASDGGSINGSLSSLETVDQVGGEKIPSVWSATQGPSPDSTVTPMPHLPSASSPSTPSPIKPPHEDGRVPSPTTYPPHVATQGHVAPTSAMHSSPCRSSPTATATASHTLHHDRPPTPSSQLSIHARPGSSTGGSTGAASESHAVRPPAGVNAAPRRPPPAHFEAGAEELIRFDRDTTSANSGPITVRSGDNGSSIDAERSISIRRHFATGLLRSDLLQGKRNRACIAIVLCNLTGPIYIVLVVSLTFVDGQNNIRIHWPLFVVCAALAATITIAECLLAYANIHDKKWVADKIVKTQLRLAVHGIGFLFFKALFTGEQQWKPRILIAAGIMILLVLILIVVASLLGQPVKLEDLKPALENDSGSQTGSMNDSQGGDSASQDEGQDEGP